MDIVKASTTRRLTAVISALALVGGASLVSPLRVGAAPTTSLATLPTSGVNPVGAAPGAIFFSPSSVACPTSTTCVSVGSYVDSFTGTDGVVSVGNLGTNGWSWTNSTIDTSTLTPTAVTSSSTTQATVSPFSIACPSASECLMTGNYVTTLGDYEGFIGVGSLTGGTWAWSFSSMDLTGLSPSAATSHFVNPSALSCASPVVCVITGSSADNAGATDGFVDVGTWNGSAWTWSISTLSTAGLSPSAQSTAGRVSPLAAACPSPTSCFLSGSYLDSAHAKDGFVDVGTWNGSAWTWSISTLSTAGLSPAPLAGAAVIANVIGCASPSTCLVMGQYKFSTTSFGGFVDVGTWNGSAWTWAISALALTGLTPSATYTTTAPATATNVTPAALSCGSSSQCVATGYYNIGPTNTDGFIGVGRVVAGTWTWSLSTLATTGLTPAANSEPQVQPSSIACPSITRCLLDGIYNDANSPNNDVYGFAGDTSHFVTASTPTITNLPTRALVLGTVHATVSTTGDGTVSLVSSQPAVCRVTGLTVSLLSAGQCTLTALVADGPTYAGASGVAQSFTVIKATQSALTLTSPTSVSVTTRVALRTRGGSGTGALSYRLVGGKCSLSRNVLSVRRASACVVVATKAATTVYSATSSPQTTYFFGFHAQKALTLKVSRLRSARATPVVLSATGGSGTGKVTYRALGAHCVLVGTRLHATAATRCVVTATRGWSATWLPATSKSATVTFT